MDAEAWKERWREGQLGFHQAQVNALLEQHWPALDVPPTASVLVPLCGKTLDIHWLRARGHTVLGVELSDIAVRDFFAEAGLRPESRHEAPFDVREADGIRLLCGDLFALTETQLGGVRGVYDRAALIALPPGIRRRYAAHLSQVLPTPCTILLITLAYPDGPYGGPPFSVPDDEVHSLYGGAFEVERLAQRGPGPAPPHLAQRGLESVSESVFALRR